MIRTARRKTSLPSIWSSPPISQYSASSALPSASRSQPSSWPGPSTASSTAAPDPSANRMAVLRSVQSVIRASVSVPMTRIFSAPSRDEARGRRRGRRPSRSRRRSGRTRRSVRPSSCWTVADVAGTSAVGCGGGENERVDVARVDARHARAPGGRPRPTARRWCRRRDARGCRCARRSSRRFVSNICLEVVVGDDLRRAGRCPTR